METVKLPVNFFTNFLRMPVLQKTAGSLFTQGMLSIANFVVAFSIAKYASKSEYGIYVILFSIIGIAGNYQSALVNTPLTVLVPKKDSTEKVLFVSGLGFGQWILYLPLIILSIIIVTIYSLFYQDFTLLHHVLVLSLGILTYLLYEFIRTVNYSKLRIHLLVKMDALFVIFVALGISILIVFHKVTCSYSITILGAGYFIAAIFGISYAQDTYIINWKSIVHSFRETWRYSRWALIGVTSNIFMNRGYIYIVSASLGLEKIAEISLARLLLRPVGLFLSSSGNITLAKGAEVLNIKGLARFKMLIMVISCFLVLVCISYLFGLWILYDYLISFLGEKYGSIQGFLFLWGIFFLVHSLRYPITNALVVCKEFKALAKYDVMSAIITIASCLILTKTFEGYGTIISLIVGELVMLLFASSRLLVFLKQNNLSLEIS